MTVADVEKNILFTHNRDVYISTQYDFVNDRYLCMLVGHVVDGEIMLVSNPTNTVMPSDCPVEIVKHDK